MVHLHCWSWFSFLRGGSSPESLVAEAVKHGQQALALTDYMSVAGVVRFQVAARKHDINPIVGSEIVVDGFPLVFLAANQNGYGTLNRLLTKAHELSEPMISLETLQEDNEGLFVLTGGHKGLLYTLLEQKQFTKAKAFLETLKSMAPNRVFVELVRHFHSGEKPALHCLDTLARETKTHTLITNAVRHARQEDLLTHDLLNCIRLKVPYDELHEERPRNDQAYLKSSEEMKGLIARPIAYANTLELAKECRVDLLPGEITPPGTQLPLGFSDHKIYLRHLCDEALPKRYPEEKQRRRAKEILEHELAIINELDVGEFFLVVREVMDYSRSRGIRCAGRGSAANSIVAFLLEITRVCPIEHRLLFERFLHAGRKGTPDIDVDFDTSRRDEIIDWMLERFSIQHTAMTANVNIYGLKGAVQDVAKVLGWSKDISIHQLTKGLSGHTSPCEVRQYRDALAKVTGEVPLLNTLLSCVERLEGCPRHLSLHSGGMLLARKPLWNFTSVQTSANGVKQAVFNRDDVEYLGLVKLDVLGLRAMSTISYALELIEETTGEKIDLDSLPLDDPNVYDLICSGQTIGLFQVESPGQINLLAKTQPRSFRELVIQIAILRPGPIEGGVLPHYVKRLRGLEATTPPHRSLQAVLEDTGGMILYQEQVLEISHVFAGLTLEEADNFRRLMSKARNSKHMEEMRERFVTGAMATHADVTKELADELFDKVAKFTGYGFPKSHACAFALNVYYTAFLKRYYPAAYMAGVMYCHPGMYPQISFVEEARKTVEEIGKMGIPVLPPDVTKSRLRHALEQHQVAWAIRQALTDVNGVGEEDARAIVLEREVAEFDSLDDFCQRTRRNSDVLDALAQAGALDALPRLQPSGLFEAPDATGVRREVLWQVGILKQRLGEEMMQGRLFPWQGLGRDELARLLALTPMQEMAWDMRSRGSTTGPHPLKLKRYELKRMGVIPINQVAPNYADASSPNTWEGANKLVTVAGLVVVRQRPETAKGVVFITLQDETDSIQCVTPVPVWNTLQETLRGGALIVTGVVQRVNHWKGLTIVNAHPLRFEVGLGVRGNPGELPSKRKR